MTPAAAPGAAPLPPPAPLPAWPTRALGLLLGAACVAAALGLASHHPLSPAAALAGVLLLAGAQAAWAPLWLLALPALMPWLGLGAWSGWFVVDEMDLAVLAAAGGGWLGWALRPWPVQRPSRLSRGVHGLGLGLLGLWATLVLVAMLQGVQAAGGWPLVAQSGWWHGWREPGNALRAAKPTLAVLLLLPLWWRVQQRPHTDAAARLTQGLALALAGLALWCLWERQGGTGLLNMATDYRTTGPFWETHMGGAALDIALALTLPFALAWGTGVRRPLAVALAALLVLAGAYSALTTFSRIVLAAVPLGVLVWALMRRGAAEPAAGRSAAGRGGWAHGPAGPANPAAPDAGDSSGLLGLGLLAVAVAALGAWQFPHAGYRGTLALLGNAVLLLWLVPANRAGTGRSGVLALAVGLAGTAVLVPAALWVPKGPYGLYALAALATAAGLVLARSRPDLAWVAGAAYVWQLAASVAVAGHWGGASAWLPAGVAAVVLAALWAWGTRRAGPPWPSDWRPLLGVATGLGVLLSVVAVFLAGQHISGRLADTAADTDTRGAHFRDGLALMGPGGQFWLGQGLGRFADLYALNARAGQRPGDIRLVPTDGGAEVHLVAGDHPIGEGEMLRLSQRVSWPPPGPLTVVLTLRTEAALRLHAELCVKHLLYAGEDCRRTAAQVPAHVGAHTGAQTAAPTDGPTTATAPAALPAPAQGLAAATADTPRAEPGWQTLRLSLPASDHVRHDLLPRFLVFSLGSETPLKPFALRRVQLLDANGQDWLHNGDFARGGARWFSTSDKHHLPWHAKNLGVHLLVEQGVVGALVFGLVGLAALATLAGPLRSHRLAAPLVGAIVGVLVVGLVDSVLDMPRVATWLLLMLWMALSLHQPSRALRPSGRSGPRGAPSGGHGDGGGHRPAPTDPAPNRRA